MGKDIRIASLIILRIFIGVFDRCVASPLGLPSFFGIRVGR